MDVRELDIDLIDSINPFGDAYAILAKSMDEKRLARSPAVIAAKRENLTLRRGADLPCAPCSSRRSAAGRLADLAGRLGKADGRRRRGAALQGKEQKVTE